MNGNSFPPTKMYRASSKILRDRLLKRDVTTMIEDTLYQPWFTAAQKDGGWAKVRKLLIKTSYLWCMGKFCLTICIWSVLPKKLFWRENAKYFSVKIYGCPLGVPTSKSFLWKSQICAKLQFWIFGQKFRQIEVPSVLLCLSVNKRWQVFSFFVKFEDFLIVV